MKHFLEKISILSLSLMLVSTFAVTPALPDMIAFYDKQGIAGSQVEFLITATSFAIMATLLIAPVLEKILPERLLISLGLLFLAGGGSLPFFTASYVLVFLGRLVLGVGIGLINARAISLISTHFHGEERLQLLGLRGSAEVLGSASLTALVGFLLPFGWSTSFVIYLFAVVILGLYLAFVPDTPADTSDNIPVEKARLGKKQWQNSLFLAIIAGFVIHINTVLTLKIPLMLNEMKLGTPSQASLVLSAMMLMGIVAGVLFSRLIQLLKAWLLPLAMLIFTLMIGLVSLSSQLVSLALGAILSGFCYSIVLTIIFNKTSENTPRALLSQKMTIVLMGCNLGGASASLIPALLEPVLPTTQLVLVVYAGLGLVLTTYLIWSLFPLRKT